MHITHFCTFVLLKLQKYKTRESSAAAFQGPYIKRELDALSGATKLLRRMATVMRNFGFVSDQATLSKAGQALPTWAG
jgi:hypothetical protein